MKFKGMLFSLVVFILWSCATLTIASVKENPQRYAGEMVSLSGRAVSPVKVPLTPLSVYMLKDDSGQIPVISKGEKKDNQRVSGSFKVIAFVGEDTAQAGTQAVKDLTAYLEENQLLEGKLVELAAKGAVKVIQTLSASATGTYFLVEKE